MLRMIERIRWRLLFCVAGGLSFLLYAMNLVFGNLNQDEGWYLYAARRGAQGLRPFRDFFFTQGPVMPRVYGWLYPLWSPLGVAGGRLVTAGFGMVSIGLCAWLAARLGEPDRRRETAAAAALLSGGNLTYSYFTTIPKTYALAACLLLAGALALTAIRGTSRRSLIAAATCAVALACATGVRLSLGASLAVVGVWLLFQRRRFGVAWMVFGLAGMVTLALLYVPILLAAPAVFQFSLGFHALREGGRGMGALLLAGGSVARTAQAYLVPVLLAVGLLLHCLTAKPLRLCRPDRRVGPPFVTPVLLAAFVSVFLVHLFSPHPYDDYQTPVIPLALALLASALWRAASERTGALGLPMRCWGQAALWVCMLLGMLASPLLQDWFVIGQDRFWVRMKPEPDLRVLQRAGRWVRANTAPGDLILTQDAYLAVEARRELPSGLEMGPFSFFPDLPDEEARRLHVVNRNRMRKLITEAAAPVAAVSGYGFALHAPALTPVSQSEREAWIDKLATAYRQVKQIPDFGQHHTELTLWERMSNDD